MDETESERIVRLETHQQHQMSFNTEVITRLDSIDAKVGVISDWVQNKGGFIAGVVFCVGICAAMLGAVSSHIWDMLTRHGG